MSNPHWDLIRRLRGKMAVLSYNDPGNAALKHLLHEAACSLEDFVRAQARPKPILPESRGTTAQELHRMHTEAEASCLREAIENLMNPPCHVSELVPPSSTDPAEACLRKALDVVTGARRKAYGTPEQNFERISRLWQTHLMNKTTDKGIITPTDVAIMMILVKVARLQETPDHADSWVDTAGYAACGVRTSGATV